MKCYGYSADNQEDLKELSEIGILATPKMLRSLASFINKCADEIENEPDWDHEHLCDFIKLNEGSVDIIINKITEE